MIFDEAEGILVDDNFQPFDLDLDEPTIEDDWGCIGSECLNISIQHTRDECFTAEDIESMYE